MSIFFIASVIVGAAMLTAVIINYLRSLPIQSVTATVTIIILGFVLVSAPLWSSITVKSENFELSLLRDLSRDYIGMTENTQRLLPTKVQKELSERLNQLKELNKLIESESRPTYDLLKQYKDAANRTLTVTTEYVSAAVEG